MCWLQDSAVLWRYPTFLLYPLALLACMECFAGYHAWRFLLGLNGAILGFIAGVILGMMLGAPLLVLLAGIAGAIAGAFLFAGIPPLGSTVFVFASVASFTILLAHCAGLPSDWYLPLAGIAGIAAAAAVLPARRPVMITVAAIAGAQQIAAAWSAYRPPCDSNPRTATLIPAGEPEWCLFLLLALAGLLVQFATSRAPPPKSPPPQ